MQITLPRMKETHPTSKEQQEKNHYIKICNTFLYITSLFLYVFSNYKTCTIKKFQNHVNLAMHLLSEIGLLEEIFILIKKSIIFYFIESYVIPKQKISILLCRLLQMILICIIPCTTKGVRRICLDNEYTKGSHNAIYTSTFEQHISSR